MRGPATDRQQCRWWCVDQTVLRLISAKSVSSNEKLFSYLTKACPIPMAENDKRSICLIIFLFFFIFKFTFQFFFFGKCIDTDRKPCRPCPCSDMARPEPSLLWSRERLQRVLVAASSSLDLRIAFCSSSSRYVKSFTKLVMVCSEIYPVNCGAKRITSFVGTSQKESSEITKSNTLLT